MLRRVVLARLMDERLPAGDLRAARAIVDRCRCGLPATAPQPRSPRPRRQTRPRRAWAAASREAVWRAAASTAGSIAIIVALVYRT
jgi:hypothetical protein